MIATLFSYPGDRVRPNETYIVRPSVRDRIGNGLCPATAGRKRGGAGHPGATGRSAATAAGCIFVEEFLPGSRSLDGQAILPVQHAAPAFGDVEPAADRRQSARFGVLGRLQYRPDPRKYSEPLPLQDGQGTLR